MLEGDGHDATRPTSRALCRAFDRSRRRDDAKAGHTAARSERLGFGPAIAGVAARNHVEGLRASRYPGDVWRRSWRRRRDRRWCNAGRFKRFAWNNYDDRLHVRVGLGLEVAKHRQQGAVRIGAIDVGGRKKNVLVDWPERRVGDGQARTAERSVRQRGAAKTVLGERRRRQKTERQRHAPDACPHIFTIYRGPWRVRFAEPALRTRQVLWRA